MMITSVTVYMLIICQQVAESNGLFAKNTDKAGGGTKDGFPV